jgi:hypothetical protein
VTQMKTAHGECGGRVAAQRTDMSEPRQNLRSDHAGLAPDTWRRANGSSSALDCIQIQSTEWLWMAVDWTDRTTASVAGATRSRRPEHAAASGTVLQTTVPLLPRVEGTVLDGIGSASRSRVPVPWGWVGTWAAAKRVARTCGRVDAALRTPKGRWAWRGARGALGSSCGTKNDELEKAASGMPSMDNSVHQLWGADGRNGHFGNSIP